MDLPFGATVASNSIMIACTDRNIWKLVSEAENKALDYKLSKTPGKINPYILTVYGSTSEIESFKEFIETMGKES